MRYYNRLFEIECEESVVSKLVSPNKKFIITVFEKNCGATALPAIHVNLQNFYDNFNSKKGEIILITEDASDIKAIWKNNNIIILNYDSYNIFKKETKFKNVIIKHNPN